jgi:uncharacterized membrane protein YfcA
LTDLTRTGFVVLGAVFFVTCAITVVTGGTALITVPAMILFGIPARTALATNMVTLTLMSMGGTLPFLRGNTLDLRRAPGLIALTLMGSILGAMLVFLVPAEILPLIIPIAMLVVVGFLLANPRQGLTEAPAPPRGRVRTGYLVAFALAMSRLMNIASSLIASGVFAWHGAVE